jgi:rhodanese-related sulfurtransferase
LGSPFEKLNIGESWSGANLGGAASGRRSSLDPTNSLMASPGKSQLGTSFSFGGPPDNQKMSIDEPSKKPPLPQTLAMRRASLPRNHVNIHGPAIAKTASPLASSSKTGSSSKAQPLAASSLKPILSNPGTLVLDLRPPSSYQASHLPQSHSLPIPSTLLRRPAFTIEKLTAMLSATSMEAVSQWRSKSDIVLIDQDSSFVPDGSVLDGLAGKFAREGYNGHLWFVKGGHGAVRSSGAGLIQSGEEEAPSQLKGPSGSGLMGGGMGRTAFQHSKSQSNLQY